MKKDTQHDFGLLEAVYAAPGARAARDLAEAMVKDEARPLYHPLRFPTDPQAPAKAPIPHAAVGLPMDAKARKSVPLYSGVFKYFPDALIEVAKCSFAGNEQHHPGTPLHWDKSKSLDHEDCILRHLMDATLGVPMDVAKLPDGRVFETPHLAKVAWRALALLQSSLEAQKSSPL